MTTDGPANRDPANIPDSQAASGIDWSKPDNLVEGEPRTLTTEQRAYWEQAVAEEIADRPNMIERERLIRVAENEPTVAGQLRRAIRTSKIEHAVLVKQCDVSVRELGDFLCGRATLDSDTFSRLAEMCELELTGIK